MHQYNIQLTIFISQSVLFAQKSYSSTDFSEAGQPGVLFNFLHKEVKQID